VPAQPVEDPRQALVMDVPELRPRPRLGDDGRVTTVRFPISDAALIVGLLHLPETTKLAAASIERACGGAATLDLFLDMPDAPAAAVAFTATYRSTGTPHELIASGWLDADGNQIKTEETPPMPAADHAPDPA
jgi:hypothetical protein